MFLFSKSNFVHLLANVVTVLFAFFIAVQLMLVAGILPISIAWGGRQTELTPALRVTGVAATFILGGFIYIIRYRAGLLGNTPIPKVIRISSWVVTGFMALNTVGNFASVNSTEKFLFTPLTLVIAIGCFIVSASNIRKIESI